MQSSHLGGGIQFVDLARVQIVFFFMRYGVAGAQ